MVLSSVDLLKRLIAHPSVSSEPMTDLAAELATFSEDAGFTVHRFQTSPGKQNVVAHIGPINEEGIALSGHMDVVPVRGQPWNSDPFTAHIEDDKHC